jgi:catalase-peroxidase
MGPKIRYLGPEVPAEDLIWQDPIPKADYAPIDTDDVAQLKIAISNSGLTIPQLVTTAWASASTYRQSDHRGGANGGRIRWSRSGTGRSTARAARTRASVYEGIKAEFDGRRRDGKKVSIADLIVLGGSVGVEQAASRPAMRSRRPSRPAAPMRARSTRTRTASTCSSRKRTASATTSKCSSTCRRRSCWSTARSCWGLSAPEMTVLVGGLRVLGRNHPKAEKHGVFTDRPGS